MHESISGIDLKVMRVKASVKAIDVAIYLKWSPSKLSLIENGRILVSQDSMMKIKDAVTRLSNSGMKN
jgi:hypothetical protein